MKTLTLIALTALTACGSGKFPNTMKVRAQVTAYCAGECCCGIYADGQTSTGADALDYSVQGCAVDPQMIPYGSDVVIPGTDEAWKADDTGSSMRCAGAEGVYHIDLRMPHDDAVKWGRQWLDVVIYTPAG